MLDKRIYSNIDTSYKVVPTSKICRNWRCSHNCGWPFSQEFLAKGTGGEIISRKGQYHPSGRCQNEAWHLSKIGDQIMCTRCTSLSDVTRFLHWREEMLWKSLNLIYLYFENRLKILQTIVIVACAMCCSLVLRVLSGMPIFLSGAHAFVVAHA